MKRKKILKMLSKGLMVLTLTAIITIGIMSVTSNAVTYIWNSITLTASNNTYRTTGENVEAGIPIFRLHVSGVTAGQVNLDNTLMELKGITYKTVEKVTARGISGPKYLDYYYKSRPEGYKCFSIQISQYTNSAVAVTINSGYVRVE